MQILTKIRNWRMERIPKIERPSCVHCKQTMYWHTGKQDWACKPCDDYNFWMEYGDLDQDNEEYY